jgi:5-methylcytosine-specific restriction protein A
MLSPLCEFCQRDGKAVRAVIADHVERHGGSIDAFWGNPLQSLCSSCHSHRKQALEQPRGRDPGPRYDDSCDEFGWPLHPDHPTNRAKAAKG